MSFKNDKKETLTYLWSKITGLVDSVSTELNNNKVDKVEGKGLSTEDFTTEEKNKIAGISSCIVCSLEQPTNLKKGLWIKTDKVDKDVIILIATSTDSSYNDYIKQHMIGCIVISQDSNDNSDISKQVAVSCSYGTYDYKQIKSIHYIDETGNVEELQFSKIENYQSI